MPSQATSEIVTTVARNIRMSRAASGLTQRQVAEEIGVDSMLLSKWERAKHRPLDRNLAELARIFGRDIAWFYTDHDQVAA